MKKLDTVPNGEMIIYENSDGKTIIDVRFDEDTLQLFPFWKQLRQMERIIQPNIIIWML